MERIINELLKCNIEIEGLLRVIESRDTEYARNVLSEKIDDFNALYASLTLSCPISDEAPAEKDETQTQSAEEIPQSSDEDPEIGKDSETDDVGAVEPRISEQPDSETIDNQAPVEDCPMQTNASSITETPQTVHSISTSGRDDTLRMDEVLSRREAQDLRRAFTLNDKFRYRRELFGSNDALFADTLNTLSAMHDLDEALDFLYKDMGWDLEDDNVKDFVATITNHFNAIK